MAKAMKGNTSPSSTSPTAANDRSIARLTTRTETGTLWVGAPAPNCSSCHLPGIVEMDMMSLSVPGTLRYRDVVLRVVASACKLMRALSAAKQETSRDDDFDDKVVSAVGEAFNNVAIHAYRGLSPGAVELTFELAVDSI